MKITKKVQAQINHSIVRSAVGVALYDPQIRKFLLANDPQAVKQLECAMGILQATLEVK